MVIKAICFAVATIIGALLVAGPGFAQRVPEGSGEVPKPPAPIERPPATPGRQGLSEQTRGEVLAVNPAARILVVVSTDWKQMAFLVAEDAAVDLAHVRRGDSVTVRYTQEDGRFIARAISKG